MSPLAWQQRYIQQSTKTSRARSAPTPRATAAMMIICSIVIPAQENHTKTEKIRTLSPTIHMHKKAQWDSLHLASSAACIEVNCPGGVLYIYTSECTQDIYYTYEKLIQYPQWIIQLAWFLPVGATGGVGVVEGSGVDVSEGSSVSDVSSVGGGGSVASIVTAIRYCFLV